MEFIYTCLFVILLLIMIYIINNRNSVWLTIKMLYIKKWITYYYETLDIIVIHKVIHIIHNPVYNILVVKAINKVHIIEK